MAIAAHFEETTDSKRRNQRRTLLLDAAGAPARGGPTRVLIHNLSETGLLIECEAALKAGETIAIDLPQAGPTAAEVVWSSGRLHGCRFETPLGKAALSAAELRSAVEGATDFASSDLEPLDQRIRRLRAARGLSLDRLAEEMGVSKPTVWAWEQGRARPAETRIKRLAKALGVEATQLVPAFDTDERRELLAQSRSRIAEAFGIAPENVRIMIEF